MPDIDVKEPVKESYESPEIIGEKGSPEAEAIQKEGPTQPPQPPVNPNVRFNAIAMFDNKINENFDNLLMPPQYAGNRVLFVRKGKISARNFDKIVGVDTGQYEIKETDPGYVKPEVENGSDQKNS